MESVDLEKLRSALAGAGPGLLGGYWVLREPAMCTALAFLPACARGPVLAFAAELVWAQDPVPYKAWIEGGMVWLDDGQGDRPHRLGRCDDPHQLALQPELLIFFNKCLTVCRMTLRTVCFAHLDHLDVLEWRVLGNLLCVRSDAAGGEGSDLSLFDLRRLGEEQQSGIGLLAQVKGLHGRLAELPLEEALRPPERCKHIVEELCRRMLSLAGAAAVVGSPVEAAPDVAAAESAEPAAADAASDAQGAQRLMGTAAPATTDSDTWVESDAKAPQCEWVDLVRLTRYRASVQEALHVSRELEAVRAAAERAGQSCRHRSGASVFLHPSDRERVLRAVREEALRPHHILANRAFLPVIREALARLRSRRGVHIRTVAFAGCAALEEVYVVERTFLSARPRRLRAAHVRRVLPASSSSGVSSSGV